MLLHPCECGEAEFEWREQGLVQRGGRMVATYSGECERCGRPRVFEFALLPEPPPPPPALGGSAPSWIIDPGEFLQTGRLFAATAPDDPAALGDDEFHGAYDALAFAIATVEEALKFIPEDADAVPVEAFHTATGRRLCEESPDQFTRSSLAATLAGYRRRLACYDAALTVDVACVSSAQQPQP